NTASFTFEASEPSTFTCQLIGPTMRGPVACASSLGNTGAQTYAGLSEGLYTFIVQATDAGGNASSARFSWRLDQTPPAVTINVPSSGATYPVGATVAANYSCADTLSGVKSCVGPLP